MGFFIFLFVLLALLNILFPRFGWYMRYGWMVKGDVEPSEAYLLMTRVSSIVALIVLFFIWSSF
ncbi:hypothetical protein QNH28_11630 [Paenibacillus sp. G2S3]|uniref:DUF6199 family natural product biosynthesis protein n=1 Tax=Paenibacillus sp. G2S3 TaxID=3047872 RepID=UPI0024C0F2B2|nr:DUF6199 family natural product biosynthesis protein [Paenibacillus sp. G2S3]WHY21586.1 hypothetical protein QNH28_11630 [Paenibacillus sp. G2S3]